MENFLNFNYIEIKTIKEGLVLVDEHWISQQYILMFRVVIISLERILARGGMICLARMESIEHV